MDKTKFNFLKSNCKEIHIKKPIVKSDNLQTLTNAVRIFGFTLAEVLITLGIIGVVAALTIPALISKYQKMVFATKAKQTYSILSNALITSVAENGPMKDWNYGASSNKGWNSGSEEDLTYIVNTYFKPYFKVAEDIGYKNGNYSLSLSNGMTLSFLTSGSVDTNTNIYTPSGIFIMVSNNRNTTSFSDKSRDWSRHDLIFVVSGLSKNTAYPFAWGSSVYNYTLIKSRDELINNEKYGCKKEINRNFRVNCTALIMWDGWRIKEDYPW